MNTHINKRVISSLFISYLSIIFSFNFIGRAWAQNCHTINLNYFNQELKRKNLQQRLEYINNLHKNLYPELKKEDVCKLIAVLRNKQLSSELRLSAILALRGIGTGAEEAINPLIQVLNDKTNDKELRRNSILALRSIYIVPALSNIINALNDEDYGVRKEAASALRSISNSSGKSKFQEKDILKLINLLKSDQNNDVRQEAARTLSNFYSAKNTNIVPALISALKDPAWYVRKNAVESLGEIGSKIKDNTDISELTENLYLGLSDKNYTLRSTVIGVLGKIGLKDEIIVHKLNELLIKDANEFVRSSAATTLAQISADDEETTKKMIVALEDEAPIVRQSSVNAIKEIAYSLEEKIYEKKNQTNRNYLDRAIKILEDANEKMTKNPNFGFAKTDIEAIQKRLTRLQAEKNKREITNIFLKNPFLWIMAIYIMSSLLIFGFRPLWLIKIDKFLKDFTLKIPFLNLDLSASKLIFGKYHTRVLDAWVAAHIKLVREEFQEKETVREREIYIPMPVVLNGRTVAQLTSQDLRSTFKQHLLIWGEGGAGKTSLAFQIAKWAISNDETERICKHQMLPILIEEDISGKQSLFTAVHGQLEDLINEPEPISEEFLKHLLRERRILVFVDHLSEMSEETRQLIHPEMPDFPVNALIVTSRIEEKLGHVIKTTIKPLRIEGNRLSSFIEAYLTQLGKRDLFPDSEFFNACSRLSMMVGQRNITPLLAKLYVEQLIIAKVGTIQNQDITLQVPDNIPDLMLSYLNELNRDVKQNKLDDRVVHHDAQVVAWECLKETYRPISARREQVLLSLNGNDAENRLRYLEERLHLIQTVSPSENYIRFNLDPLSEYLAALHLIKTYDSDENLWRTFVQNLETVISEETVTISSFIMALRDCFFAKRKEMKLPGFIIDKLTKIQEKSSEVSDLVNAQLPTSGERIDQSLLRYVQKRTPHK